MKEFYYLSAISILILSTGWMIYRRSWITLDGVFVLWLMGMAAGINGFFWFFPLGYFLVTGTILTKLQTPHKKNIKKKTEDKIARNGKQLLANGALAAFFGSLYFFSQDELFYFLYITAIAVNLFDTWCSEIGTLLPSKTYSLQRLKEVPQGVSGGITVLGTGGGWIGLLGYLFMVYVLTYFKLLPSIDLSVYVAIFISSTSGGFFDSILGIYEKEEGFPGAHGATKKIPWLKNNMVNFLSSVFGSLVFLLLYAYI